MLSRRQAFRHFIQRNCKIAEKELEQISFENCANERENQQNNFGALPAVKSVSFSETVCVLSIPSRIEMLEMGYLDDLYQRKRASADFAGRQRTWKNKRCHSPNVQIRCG